MRFRLLLAGVLVPLLLWVALPVASPGQSRAKLDQIQSKIAKTRSKIGRKKGTERVLSTEIAAYSRRIGRLERKIDVLRGREAKVQGDLDLKRAQLARTQAELREQRRRLARLRTRLAEAMQVIGQRAVALYQADEPDVVSAVLASDGFADLLERGQFVKRIRRQDQRIVETVRAAKKDATSTAKRLDVLEVRQQKLTTVVLKRRDQLATIKGDLIDTQVGYKGTQDDKQAALGKVRSDRHELQEDLEQLEKASARITQQLQGPSAIPVGPIKGGGGPWIWPVNGPVTGQFGEQRPGHIHAGRDIAAPEGTPIRAAANGRVVLIQGIGASGGYGNYTCVRHRLNPPLDSCYAHQSRFGTTMGASVHQGQVIGYVGNTGHSFGAHLHFEARENGVPVNPGKYLGG